MIGLGCFYELLRMAAAEDGYHLEVEWFPQGVSAADSTLDQRPIANIHWHQGAKPDPLFAQVLHRRSYKQAFKDQSVDDEQMTRLLALPVPGCMLAGSNDKATTDVLRNLTKQAMAIELATPATYYESTDLLRIGTDEVKANPDGIDLDGYGLMALRMLGLYTHKEARDMNSMGYEQAVSGLLEELDSAFGYAWLISPANHRQDQILAGQNYLRLNLHATAMGLSMQPVSQGLQEYPEMQKLAEKLREFVGIKAPQCLQMLVRLGYGETIPPSPRWPVQKVIT